MENPAAKKRHATWAIHSESHAAIRAALALAQSTLPIADDGEGWDSNPMLLGCMNGVLDLRSGLLRPGTPEDRITMHVPHTFDPDARCPRWELFLQEVFGGDASLIGFVRRACGYSLTGDISEQVFFMLHGEGANGKSLLLQTLSHVLGNFATDTGFGFFEHAS